jgi:ribosome-binding protein aMBF1 (putative translation factor)
VAKSKKQTEPKVETYTEITRTPDGRAEDANVVRPLSGAIRRALTDTGLSSYQIAARVGITPPAMHRFLTGERGLSLEMLDRVIVAMELEVIVRPKAAS